MSKYEYFHTHNHPLPLGSIHFDELRTGQKVVKLRLYEAKQHHGESMTLCSPPEKKLMAVMEQNAGA